MSQHIACPDYFNEKLKTFEFSASEFKGLSYESQEFVFDLVEEIFYMRELSNNFTSNLQYSKIQYVIKRDDTILGIFESMDKVIYIGCILILNDISNRFNGIGRDCYDYIQSVYDLLAPDNAEAGLMITLLRKHFRKNKSFGEYYIEEQKVY